MNDEAYMQDPFQIQRVRRWQWSAVAFALVLYSWSLAPTTFWLDSAQLQVRALEAFQWSPDARQYPLYIFMARLLTLALSPVNAAWGLNALTAAFGCLAVYWLFELLTRLRISAPAALAGCVAYTVAHTVWYVSVITEVYTLFALLLFGMLAAVVRWSRERPQSLYGAAFLLGLGMGHHRLMWLALAPLGLYVWLRRAELTPGVRRRSFGVFLVGLLPLASWAAYYLWSGHTVGEFFNAYFFSGIPNWRTVMQDVSPTKFGKSALLFALFFVYNFVGAALIFGAAGFVSAWRRRTPETWLFVSLAAVNMAFGLDYNVEDQWVFFLPVYAVFVVWVAQGADAWLRRLQAREKPFRRWAVPVMLVVLAATPILTYAVTPRILADTNVLPAKRANAEAYYRMLFNPSRRGDRAAYEFARRVFDEVPRNSVLLCDAASYSVLRYFQQSENVGHTIWLGFLDSTDADYLRSVIAEHESSHEVYLVLNPFHPWSSQADFERVGKGVGSDLSLYKADPTTGAKALIMTRRQSVAPVAALRVRSSSCSSCSAT
ncbi:MAG: DUF2723 domain-containing protein [Candidatus Lernaella stagnicola]|nr:DUF2723 domain-containing protein [Candidatus Lernaella stagnicola]